MASTKNFFHDRTALLLVSAASFLTLLSIVLILLKINAARGTVNYIVGYRANLGLDRYITGTVVDMLSFIFAALLIFGMGTLLGYRAYKIRRELSLTVLALTLPLLAFLIVVSNALLTLR